ncbi:metal-dependent hydrolase [Burkholderia gladioli]|uniref:metal-dependent hydrolase n=1 Tax=Burkholderia gladioli TaxID=28095 RepID=UPI00164123C7|nr:metal-dependent hydrolase [Burkholderia gladioli]
MSSKPVHYTAGAVLGAGAAWQTWSFFEPWQVALVFAGCLCGSSSPDFLELPWWSWFGTRHSLIPHRTITHWMLAWVILTAWVWLRLWREQSFWWCIAAGFCASSLLHVLMDYNTPMGVPVFHPWKRTRRRNAHR